MHNKLAHAIPFPVMQLPQQQAAGYAEIRFASNSMQK